MLTKVPFYFGTTRKMIVAFGGLFNNIFLRTFDAAGVTKKIVKIPLAFAQKEKFIIRLQQDPGLNEDTLISLPRLSFELVDFSYDSSRQLNKVQKTIGTRDGVPVFSYASVPYVLTFKLYSYTRTQEDNLQVLEQIVPYFSPDMNLSIKTMQNPDLTQDCSLILNGISPDDTYDGSFETRRYIITSYTFTLKMNYYGPVLGTTDPENHFESGGSVNVIKQVITNFNNSKYTATIDPFSAGPDDPYNITETWDEE